ncbi:hypothetical protein GYMLUDRAFT_240826 [Collybiopsis luxurians FD-317 M1]|nr:hypothetical protein GYMLUDRAFT_240826 [Collybiopsis luxurians FD-317 M1]
MQEWFSEEWHVVNAGTRSKGMICSWRHFELPDPNLKYQLKLQKQWLCRLYATWEWAFVGVPASDELPAWGPLEEEVFQVCGELVLGGGIDAADEEGFDVEFEAEADGLLTEHLDSLQVTRNYQEMQSEDSL